MVAVTVVVIVVATTVLGLAWRARQAVQDDLSAVPFKIVADLPIAANASAKDRSVLRLVCTDNHQAMLVLRTKLAVGREFYASGQDDGASIFVGDQNNRIETRMRLVNRSAYDTLVSTKLSGTALSALGGFFGNASPRQVSVVTLETDTKLTGQVGKGQIATFAADCR